MTRMILLLVFCAFNSLALAYPLDGEEESGIRRLQGYLLAQGVPSGAKLRPGQLWQTDEIKLHLTDYAGPDFDQLNQDPELSSALISMLSKRDPSYGLVVVDFSNAESVRWAALRPDAKQNPGSVGKLLCMLALFHTLAEVFPDQEQRAEVLKRSLVKAGDWVTRESHDVPKWNAALQKNQFSVINQSDVFRLSEWIDHAISPSANGAGAIVWREAMLVRHFGEAYPVSYEESSAFFSRTSKTELAVLAHAVITEPLIEAGIDTENLRQGSSFTSAGKQKVPGTTSFATPRELARFLFRMEQGQLVDPWSSLQMKKYMYLTKRRYRYAYAPELDEKAIFFKSGSLYECRVTEEGVKSKCGKYMGDKQNLMNSVAIVEGRQDTDARYIAVLMSNVMGVNSAWDHSRIGAATDEMIVTRRPQQLKEDATQLEITESGKSE